MIFKKISSFFLIFPLLLIGAPLYAAGNAKVSYSVHVSDIGWTDPVKDSEVAGTTGQNKAIEAIKIETSLEEDTSIEYRSHISDVGWESDFKKDGEVSGTEGQNKALEAIQIELTGLSAGNYDVYYRTHIADTGWLGWAKNGEEAGSTGMGRPIQALQIKLVPKGEDAPGDTIRHFVTKYMDPINVADTHVQDIGWQEGPYIENVIGTTGKNKQIEAIKLSYADEGSSGIEYRLHLQDKGWEEEWHKDGELSGTIGENRRAEAIEIRLTGYAAETYDIYYQAHCSDYGWLSWAKNGGAAGTVKSSKKLEAVNIKLVKKGEEAPGDTYVPLVDPISEEAFRGRLYGAWLGEEKANDAVNSFCAGFTDYYMFTGFNQTYNGIEGYYEILSANNYGGKIRVVDQQTGEPVEMYVSFENIPVNNLKVTYNGVTRTLVLGDTTDRVHYSFSGVKQYGQLAIIELKTGPKN